MVPEPGCLVGSERRLDDDQIETDRKQRQPDPTRQGSHGDHAHRGRPDVAPLAVVERLFGQPKSRFLRQRTSTKTTAGGGPRSTATRSSSSRPTRTFRARTCQPRVIRYSAARLSAASPASWNVVRAFFSDSIFTGRQSQAVLTAGLSQAFLPVTPRSSRARCRAHLEGPRRVRGDARCRPQAEARCRARRSGRDRAFAVRRRAGCRARGSSADGTA